MQALKRIHAVPGLFVLAIMICLTPRTSQAGLLEMPPTWQVRSQYQDPVTRATHTMVWSYTLDKQKPGPMLLVREQQGRTDLLVEARLEPTGRMASLSETRRVQKKQRVRTRSLNQQGPQLSTRSMIPLSLLHEPQRSDREYPRTVSERFQVQGASFKNVFTLVRERLPFNQALTRGELAPEQRSLVSDEDLLIYSLTRADGTEVLRQTWAPSLPFWLKETAPNRTSWLMPFE